MASYKALANKNKERLAQQSKGDGKKVEDQPHYGGALDLLIISSMFSGLSGLMLQYLLQVWCATLLYLQMKVRLHTWRCKLQSTS